jgi:hypothetical protein
MAEIKKQPLQQKKQPVTTTAPKQQQVPVTKKHPVGSLIFTKDNYTWMMIGGAIVLLGMLLMTGGKSSNPNVFDYKVVYSFTRITLAPILIILGLMVEIYAIFKKPKQTSNE